MQYTVSQAAAILELAPRTVRKHAWRLGCERHGRAYVLSNEDIRRIKDADHTGGRPTHE